MSIEEQRMFAEPVEEFKEILLDDFRPEWMTKISTLTSPPVRQALMTFLKEKRDVFT